MLHLTYKTSAGKSKDSKDSSPQGTTTKAVKADIASFSSSVGGGPLRKLFGDGTIGQGAEDGQRMNLGNAVELVQIRSEKEVRAKERFQKKLSKRAAGPRDKDEAPSNMELAQALANLKLDTCLNGMIQAAINPSGSPNAPAPPPRPLPSLCGGTRIPTVCSVRT